MDHLICASLSHNHYWYDPPVPGVRSTDSTDSTDLHNTASVALWNSSTTIFDISAIFAETLVVPDSSRLIFILEEDSLRSFSVNLRYVSPTTDM